MKSIITTLMFLISGSIGLAQDVHFSQMRHAPLNVNPALAGLENKMQATVNYRNQWNSVAEPFETIGASFDFRLKEKYNSNGFFAGGINFFHDNAGNANATTTNASLSLAYHLKMDPNSTFGLSIQGGYGQKGINPRAGTWGTQFVGDGFDQNLTHGEQFDATSASFPDAGAGIVYNYKSAPNASRRLSKRAITFGVAAYHVNQPAQSFLIGGNDQLAIRWSAFAHGNYSLSDTKTSLMPGIYYNRQRKFQELLVGTYLRTVVSKSSTITGFRNETALSFGLFYRLGDAFVSKFLLEYSTFSVGMAYDFNVSKLTTASNGRGGAEILLRFKLPDTHKRARNRIR